MSAPDATSPAAAPIPGSPPSPPGPMAVKPLLGQYKDVFLTGLATILPTILTFWVLTSVYGFVERNAARPINEFLREEVLINTEEGLRFSKWFWDLPLELPTPRARAATRSPAIVSVDSERRSDLREEITARYPTWLGFVLAVFVIFVIGFFTASFIGRSVWTLLEGLLTRIPIIKSVYPSAKQVVDFLIAKDDTAPQFDEVVAIEYPGKGHWTVAFVTGGSRADIREQTGEDLLTVFIPFAPTPISGFVVFVDRARCVTLNMTVDEAFKFYVTAGVIGSDPKTLPGESSA